MPTNNPYDSPEFAIEYAKQQADIRGVNRYEWSVTHRALLQLVNGHTILDYGCGPGVFSAGIALDFSNSEVIGTDVSEEILKRSTFLGENVTNLTFKHWHPEKGVDIPKQSVDTLIAKLVLNYISADQLANDTFPRFRDLISDEGMVVAVLPNPLREVKYDTDADSITTVLEAKVGGFDDLQAVKLYHHNFESIIASAASAGLRIAGIEGLPEVRFVSHKQWWNRQIKDRSMMIANPMPLVHSTVNPAKRTVYVFTKSDDATPTVVRGIARLRAWREATFPEIADRAHIRIPPEHTSDNDLATSFTGELRRDVLYDYCNEDTPPGSRQHIILERNYAEHLTAHSKLRLSRELARRGIRSLHDPSLFLSM